MNPSPYLPPLFFNNKNKVEWGSFVLPIYMSGGGSNPEGILFFNPLFLNSSKNIMEATAMSNLSALIHFFS